MDSALAVPSGREAKAIKHMQSGLGLTWIWPGLSRLWLRGEWAGLVLAAAFAASLNLALVTTFVWPQLISRGLSPIVTIVAAWILVVGFWIVGWVDFRRQRARLPVVRTPAEITAATSKLRLAQRQYLRGQYALAEQTVRQTLTPTSDDVELMLMLVSILRRTSRREEGLRWIDRITQLPAAGRWIAELESEQRLLRELSESPAAEELHTSERQVAGKDGASEQVARSASPVVVENPNDTKNKSTRAA